MKNYIEYDKESIRCLIESGIKRDLHMHTCYSDGILSPEALIKMRMSEGFELLAITDHDGIDGSVIGADHTKDSGLCFISGIEFDSEDPLGTDLHMLGYGFDYNNKDLKDALREILLNRNKRNERLMDILNKKGYIITPEDIMKENEGRYVGKPTFARILHRKGYTNDPDEAFKTVFRDEDIRSVTKITPKSKDIVELIHLAGGLAVLAHPMEQRKRGESFADYLPRLYKILDRMRDYGVDGIECMHPSASSEQSRLLCDYADSYGLVKTEGSDIHSPYRKRDYSRYHSM